MAALPCGSRAPPATGPLAAEHGAPGPRVAGAAAPGPTVQVRYLWRMGVAALRHVGFSWIQDGVHVSRLAGGFFTTEPPGKP